VRLHIAKLKFIFIRLYRVISSRLCYFIFTCICTAPSARLNWFVYYIICDLHAKRLRPSSPASFSIILESSGSWRVSISHEMISKEFNLFDEQSHSIYKDILFKKEKGPIKAKLYLISTC
jgi:hypothetical protein